MIFDVQRYSTHDGSGIRTVVFLKGCPLRCQWCSNPESQERGVEILFDAHRCILCRSCLAPEFGGAMHEIDGRVVPDRTKPVPPGLARACPTMAIRLAGREVDVDAVVAEVLKDAPFFLKSGGGVTFSGGEPLDQGEFLLRCVQRFTALGIGVAVESCLAVDPSVLAPFLDYPIEWLVDVKHVDEEKYLLQTSGPVDQALENLRVLSRSSSNVTYRIPLIPGFNESEPERTKILGFIASLDRASADAPRVDLLPYHALAAGKYHQLGRTNPYDRKALGSGVLGGWQTAAAALGMQVNLGG